MLGEACGACAKDAALGGSMLIPLSVLQTRPGGPSAMGWQSQGCGERE